MMWVVEWQQGDLKYHIVRSTWRSAMKEARSIRSRSNGRVKVMSQATYMGGSRV